VALGHRLAHPSGTDHRRAVYSMYRHHRSTH
jgi:hypothetical protein